MRDSLRRAAKLAAAGPVGPEEPGDNFVVLRPTGKGARRKQPSTLEAKLHLSGPRAEFPQQPSSESPNGDVGVERHYSVAELARLWGLSARTIRRMFENEPGVLQWGNSETRFKRSYVTLRIPETVVLRVHRQLRIAG
jgi:hypothetical protein